MLIGIPKEIKNHEYRVGATPDMVKTLISNGHQVMVQSGAGMPIGYLDTMYIKAGAQIVHTPAEVYRAKMIIKVKEPQFEEFPLLYEGQILFCFLHLAPDPEQTKHLLQRKVIGIAYETVTDKHGGLPLLIPMSEIAGRISIQAGVTALQMSYGGKGVLIGGVPGVLPGKVTVIGGGIVGTHAATMARGLGADVVILDNNLHKLRELNNIFGSSIRTLYSTQVTIEEAVIQSDLVIGAVLIPGKTAPKLVTKEMIAKMAPGSVIVDVAIDQGGCCETSRPTTHSHPTYTVDGVVHYCVTNMPGACARTATQSLTNATLPYALKIAAKGSKSHLLKELFEEDPSIKHGLNVYLGKVTNFHVAHDLGYEYFPPEKLL